MNKMSIEGFDKLVSQLILGNLAKDFDILESDTLLSDLNVDAIEKVSLAINLEEQCAVEIPDADIDSFRSVGDVVEYLEQHVAQNNESLLVCQKKNQLRKRIKVNRFYAVSDNNDNVFINSTQRIESSINSPLKLS